MLSLIQASTAPGQGVPGSGPGGPVVGRPVEQATDLATLRAQLNDLRIQLTGWQAQWNGLYAQLNVMLKNNPARAGVQQEWADIGVKIAQVKGGIAYTEARIAQAEGRPVGTTSTGGGSGPLSRPINPDVVFPAAAMLLMVLGLPVSIAWARRIFRGRPQPAPVAPDYSMRLENIEHAIDTIAIEMERVSEGQRFVTKILAERDRVNAQESNAAAPSSAAAQPKALGAGPMEPINVAQRERVRERIITPH